MPSSLICLAQATKLVILVVVQSTENNCTCIAAMAYLMASLIPKVNTKPPIPIYQTYRIPFINGNHVAIPFIREAFPGGMPRVIDPFINGKIHK